MSVFGPKWAIFYSFDAEMAYYAATLCKKIEQTYERILRSKMYARTDGRTHGGEFKGPDRLRRGTNNSQSLICKEILLVMRY